MHNTKKLVAVFYFYYSHRFFTPLRAINTVDLINVLFWFSGYSRADLVQQLTEAILFCIASLKPISSKLADDFLVYCTAKNSGLTFKGFE